MRFAVIGLSFIALCSGIVFAFDIPSKPSGFVNDYANILKVETKQKLEQELSLFSASTTNEIAIVTVKSLGDRDTIESLGIRIADTWKIGTKGNDNGIIFLISSDDKQARIEVGYGLEGIMPDTIAAQILAEDVFPNFKTGNFDAGIIAEPFRPNLKLPNWCFYGNHFYSCCLYTVISVIKIF